MNESLNTIGNYKGIMLCNRPFGGTSAVTQNGPATKPFNVSIVPEQSGLPISIINKEKIKIKRIKKDSVLTKHKKWLVELQKTKEQLEKDYESEMKAKDERMQRIQEQAKLARLNTISHNTGAADSKSQAKDDENDKESNSTTLVISSKRPSVADAKQGKSNNKPAWAKTENEADNDSDYEVDAELDDLIEFAEGLDYDKCINDIEVKLMIETMQKRIKDLEKEIHQDDKNEADSRDLLMKKDKLALMGNVIATLELEEAKRAEDRDMESIIAAKAVLENNVNLQSIHSTKSVATLIKSSLNQTTEAQPKIFNEPKIVSHDPHKKQDLNASTLPYLHRNPAV